MCLPIPHSVYDDDVFGRPGTMRDIQRVVEACCEEFEVSAHDLLSPCRQPRLARTRQAAMFLARTTTGRSYPEIGEAFNRDHTTVVYAVKRMQRLRRNDSDFRERLDHVEKVLRLRALQASGEKGATA